jgi:hypothetical protein
MNNFSNRQIKSIESIIEQLDVNDDLLELSNNSIEVINLCYVPQYIKKLFLNNNSIKKIIWDDREWDIINLSSNKLQLCEMSNLRIKNLNLDFNEISMITLIDCKFDYLTIENNQMDEINFFDCEIELSVMFQLVICVVKVKLPDDNDLKVSSALR